MKEWGEGFADEIGNLLADDPIPRTNRSSRSRRVAGRSCAIPGLTAVGGDLFALLATPWTDHETEEFLRLVGIDDGRGN